jgi:hypothetical protein
VQRLFDLVRAGEIFEIMDNWKTIADSSKVIPTPCSGIIRKSGGVGAGMG